jgi:REP-associated tyrosine transposase
MNGDAAIKAVLSPWPVRRPANWTDRVNAPLSAKELGWLRLSIERSRPFGEDEWVQRTASKLRLEHTVRPEGRPPKPRN